MKNRVLTFIIGILVGSILVTVGFLIYNKAINKNPNEIMMPMEGNGQIQRPDENMGNPPEKPDGYFDGQNVV